MAVLDHLVYAVADLEVGRRRLTESTGVTAAAGGAHPGRGTHNALASLGSSYLELIARDPAQPDVVGPIPFGLDSVTGDGLVAFAVRPDPGDTIDALVDRARAAGYEPGAVLAMSRRPPDGGELHWRNTLPPPVAGGVIPFIIDWGSSAMPSTTAPAGLAVTAFGVAGPDPDSVRAAHRAIGIDAPVVLGDPAGLTAELRGPTGTVTLKPAARSGS